MRITDITEIDIMDRTDLLGKIEELLVIDPANTAVVTVEMTKRRVNERTPLPPGVLDKLVASTEELLSAARASGIPVIHVLSSLRDVEEKARLNTKFQKALRLSGQSLSPYGEVPSEYVPHQDGTFEPDLAVSVADGDFIIKTKKSLSCFYQTDLEWLLRNLKRNYIVLAGMNTNADIISTAYEGSNRAMGVITVKECVASIYGEDLHRMALQQLGRCQGWVIDLATFKAKVRRYAEAV